MAKRFRNLKRQARKQQNAKVSCFGCGMSTDKKEITLSDEQHPLCPECWNVYRRELLNG